MVKEHVWTGGNGLSMYAREWRVERPRAIVALVHGLGEHVQRYEHVAAHLNAAGYAVLGMDLRGHGQSGGKRGHAADYAALLDDVKQLLREAELRYPALPVILYGHSLGGNLVLNYALRRKPNLRGLVATSPFIRETHPQSGVKVGLGKLMRNIYPSLTLPNGLDVNGISRDATVVERYQKDPLVHGNLSAAMGIGTLEAGQWLADFSGHVTCPTLLIHGTADPITDPEATAAFAERVQGDLTFHAFEGLYHETHNEPEQAEVLQTISDWLDAHVPTV